MKILESYHKIPWEHLVWMGPRSLSCAEKLSKNSTKTKITSTIMFLTQHCIWNKSEIYKRHRYQKNKSLQKRATVLVKSALDNKRYGQFIHTLRRSVKDNGKSWIKILQNIPCQSYLKNEQKKSIAKKCRLKKTDLFTCVKAHLYRHWPWTVIE